MQKLRLAISTCPNDTFAFHAIINRSIEFNGIEFDIELLDIQQLNDGLMANCFDVAKASFHAATRLADETIVLPSGSALGFGNGPLLLAAREGSRPGVMKNGKPNLALCPGELTTATMLFKLFYGSEIETAKTILEQIEFSKIMPALQNGNADFGVCIHEGRFTWRDQGLAFVEDLGARWEQATESPLPLGGIVVRRDLDNATIAIVQDTIRRSIEFALANREETLPTMRRYAQEFTDDVLMGHVDLYVNEWTVDLGDVGRNALKVLADKALECGLVGPHTRPLEVWNG